MAIMPVVFGESSSKPSTTIMRPWRFNSDRRAPKPRSVAPKANRTVDRAPLAALLSELNSQGRSAAVEVSQAHGLGEPVIRATKLGRRLYVEVDYLVEPGQWDVSAEDVVRRELIAKLEGCGRQVWANVELTTDPALTT